VEQFEAHLVRRRRCLLGKSNREYPSHSWPHEPIILLSRHFPDIKLDRCVILGAMHDKLEIITGDKNPVGREGTGQKTHAFNPDHRLKKDALELSAMEYYSSLFPFSAREHQVDLLTEIIEGSTKEARFVKAIDKMQAFVYVINKKQGDFHDKHIAFTLKYTRKSIEYWPRLFQHYQELRKRYISSIAKSRGISLTQAEELATPKQRDLFDSNT
jgi:5'-deoxynucleotidase YfbR-like HD superfamily hydrolase